MSSPEAPEPQPTFRDLEPIQLWSIRIQTSMGIDDFYEGVRRVAQRTGQHWSGFYTETDEGIIFTCSRYPRRKYGVKSIDDCNAIADEVTSELHGSQLPDTASDGFRIVLGLSEGYEKGTKEHTLEEIKQHLDEGFEIQEAHIFAVSPDPADTGYVERVAVIRGRNEEGRQRQVYELADEFRQARFVVEDFDSGSAHLIETRHCQDPD